MDVDVDVLTISQTTNTTPPPTIQRLHLNVLFIDRLPKSSNLDVMFEELKKKEAERASQKEKHQTQNAPTAADNDNNSIHVSDFYEASELGGSHAGPCDTRTTNLFVGNLPPEVDEEILMTDFGKYGDIASVKIMWPRTADETARKRNSGFVAFMRREAAEKAIDAMAGHVYFGNPMRVGWGKTVPLPPVPLYVSPTSSSKQDRAAATATAGAALPPTSSMPHGQYNAHFTAQFDVQPHQPALDVAVSIPQDPEVSFRCDVLAHYVALHGLSFEAEVLKREKDNPLFQFIDDSSSPDHLYYRWRIYSCCQGDDTRHWRTAPFQMVEGGGMWTPPPPPALVTLPGAGAPLPRGSGTGGASADDNGETVVVGAAADSKRIGRALTPGESSDLRAALDDLTMQRQSVRRAMAACLDASEASEDVVDVLCAPFEEVLARANDTTTTSTWASSIAATPAGLIARLYVMSDVLHNAGQAVESGLARGASSFRTLFECRLPSAFRAIKLALRSLGRLSGEEMKGRCLCVLKAWSAWRCFPDKFVSDLHDLLV